MATLTINKQSLLSNLEELKKICGTSLLIPMIKANGYGLGRDWLVDTLVSSDIDFFAVTRLSDGEEILKNHPSVNCLLTSACDDEDSCRRIVSAGLIASVGSVDGMKLLNSVACENGITVKIHIKIDTGMGRFGFSLSQLDELANALPDCKSLEVNGCFSHFANCFGEKNKDKTLKQFAAFQQAVEMLETHGVHPEILHIANSAAAIMLPETRLSAVRICSALLGRVDPTLCKKANLVKIGVLEAKVLSCRTLKKGETVGYGSVFTAKRNMEIAVLDAGHSDGAFVIRAQDGFRLSDFLRRVKLAFHNRKGLFCRLNGQSVPILGRVGVCNCVVCIDNVDCKPGDIAKINVNTIFCSAAEHKYN